MCYFVVWYIKVICVMTDPYFFQKLVGSKEQTIK